MNLGFFSLFRPPMINKSQLSLGFDFNEEEAKNSTMAKNDNNIVDSISSEGLTNQGNVLQYVGCVSTWVGPLPKCPEIKPPCPCLYCKLQIHIDSRT